MRHRLKWLLSKLHWLSDKAFLSIAYALETGGLMHWDDPRTFNEKLQWIKVYGDTERYAPLVDKLSARGFAARVIGHEHLVPLIGQYTHPEDVPWDALPDRYVVKCTHGSHCGIVVTDKRTADKADMIKRLNRWMGRNWYWHGREPPYKHLKPRIIVEELIGNGLPPVDYKFMCFDGEPEIVQIHRKFYRSRIPAPPDQIDFVTAYGKQLHWRKKGYSEILRAPGSPAIDRRKLQAMLPIARKLAQATGAPYVRVDMYHEGGKVYFSELTFFDSAGFRDFEPPEVNLKLGAMINLKEVKGNVGTAKEKLQAI